MRKNNSIKNPDRSIRETDAMPPRQLALELPQGLAASLALAPVALSFYKGLDPSSQEKVIAYIQSTDTGEAAKARTHQAVDCLGRGDLGFLG